MSRITLVLGGARSGKSRFAEGLATGRKIYIATAEAFDDEMVARIVQHQAQRGEGWQTVEAPVDLPGVLDALPESDFVLIDCITVWLGNLMHHGLDIGAEVTRLGTALARVPCPVVIVSNEVGLSIVPENAMARRFRDQQGLANQRLAALADDVYFIAAGLPLVLKTGKPARP